MTEGERQKAKGKRQKAKGRRQKRNSKLKTQNPKLKTPSSPSRTTINVTFLKKPIAMSKAGNVWTYKPWWCQPWSILLTGAVLIGGSWGLMQTVWLTVLVAVPVLVWMIFFLLVYPRLMQESGALPDATPPQGE